MRIVQIIRTTLVLEKNRADEAVRWAEAGTWNLKEASKKLQKPEALGGPGAEGGAGVSLANCLARRSKIVEDRRISQLTVLTLTLSQRTRWNSSEFAGLDPLCRPPQPTMTPQTSFLRMQRAPSTCEVVPRRAGTSMIREATVEPFQPSAQSCPDPPTRLDWLIQWRPRVEIQDSAAPQPPVYLLCHDYRYY